MIIKQEHLIESIHSALQYISYYHSPDFINAMVSAYERETNQSAKNAIEQILINSKMCALGKRPICQDTGIVNVFLEVGMNVQWDSELSLEDMINWCGHLPAETGCKSLLTYATQSRSGISEKINGLAP